MIPEREINYRMNYPVTYKTNMYILKFEKDVSSSSDIFFDDSTFQLTYTLVITFLNIVSTPISYESSNILKYTVSYIHEIYCRQSSN